MGFFKNLFKKENAETEQVVAPIKTEQVSEYHKCPVCGHENKTKTIDWSKYNKKYLDGQIKMSIQEYVDLYYYCPECGFLYADHDLKEGIPQDYYDGKIKDAVYSKTYQDIRNSDNDETYKKILLMEQIANCNMFPFANINQIWLNYYLENENKEKQLFYIKKRIDEIPKGYSFASEIRYNESVIEFAKGCENEILHISKNEIITDLYRIAGNFEEARKSAEFALSTYNFEYQNAPRKLYYEYQLKLIEAQDKRHI